MSKPWNTRKKGLPFDGENAPLLARENFIHEPLDFKPGHIRLLKILPGLPGSILRCKIWQDQIRYQFHTCLSYYWGPPDPENQIIVNNRLFNVRKNLHNFLMAARKQNLTVPLWIDALCIDQANLEERNYQVQQMAEVYQNAAEVLVYAGVATAHHQRNLDSLISRLGWTYDIFMEHCNATDFRTASRKLLRLIPIWDWNAMRSAESAYWTRMWVVQELLLGIKLRVVFSSHTLDWDHFLEYAHWAIPSVATASAPRSSSGFGTLELALRREWQQDHAHARSRAMHTSSQFQRLLLSFLYQDCENIRDRVYGIMGILPGTRNIPVRYDEDVESMILRVALQLETESLQNLISLIWSLGQSLRVKWRIRCGMCLSQGVMDEPWPSLMTDTTQSDTDIVISVKDVSDTHPWAQLGRQSSCATCSRSLIDPTKPKSESTYHYPFAVKLRSANAICSSVEDDMQQSEQEGSTVTSCDFPWYSRKVDEQVKVQQSLLTPIDLPAEVMEASG